MIQLRVFGFFHVRQCPRLAIEHNFPFSNFSLESKDKNPVEKKQISCFIKAVANVIQMSEALFPCH